MSERWIPLQILLRSQWRNPEGIRRVLDLARSLGLEPTRSGMTSLSVRIRADDFRAVFGVPFQDVSPTAARTGTLGQPRRIRIRRTSSSFESSGAGPVSQRCSSTTSVEGYANPARDEANKKGLPAGPARDSATGTGLVDAFAAWQQV